MRTLIFLPLILLGACAASLPHPAKRSVAVRVGLEGLALDRADGRAMLRERVTVAVRDFCRDHADDVTPQLIRAKTRYCVDKVRLSVFAEMPRAVRRAYAQALDEAGR